MTKQIAKIPLLITSSEKIEGLLSIDKASKYNIGLFSSINFKTYCALNNMSSNYDSNYVILTKTEKWLTPYIEPFTSEPITITDKRIIRGANNYRELVFTGNDFNLKELTLSKLGQIFPDDKSLEEYQKLFRLFTEENKLAYYEIKDILERESQALEISETLNKPNESRGMEVYSRLVKKTKRIEKILDELLEEKTTPNKIYTIKNSYTK